MEMQLDQLADATQQAHAHVVSALPPQAPTLDGVAWASVHLAAVERALYPAVLRRLPGFRSRVRMQMAVDKRLQQALWWLDRRLTGDMASASTPVEHLVGRLLRRFDEHCAGEAALLAELCEVLDEGGQKTLAGDVAALMTRAPTRPHPHTPHLGFTDPLTFAVESWVDRIRDQMDNRSVCTPRQPRVVHPVGKWGAYLTAQPYPGVRPPAVDADGRRDDRTGIRL